ncbi:hypothetical protein AAKU61_003796 [Undibacterium sp. GrIS 1.2]|uniref:hypothetical protein n=1 Tax=Undibacterium sp. GrIS 1.2 TaxID=3143933 RepID=UPI00198C2CB1|nr:hypothetical protein [Glaciimonas sp.]
MQGAGGSEGGVGKFFIGLFMMCGGFYMLFNAVMVQSSFSLGYGMYGLQAFGSNVNVTSGMIMIPFIIGIAMIFYNVKSLLGWILAFGSLGALIFGVIASLHFNLRSMSLFELIVILILAFGGLALFLSSMRSHSKTYMT